MTHAASRSSAWISPTALRRPTGRKRGGPIRVALLSPYSGANLGDAAIHEAVIQNIRRRYPDAAISGITADPHLTAARHGIPCFPISGWSARLRFPRQREASVTAPGVVRPARDVPRGEGARQFVKRLPIVGAVL